MKINVLLILVLFVLTGSCGSIQSTRAIIDADSARHKTLKLIAAAARDNSLIIKDEFGNSNLSQDAKGEAAFYFFMSDSYLRKAREFQSKAAYEKAIYVAEKSEEYAVKSESLVTRLLDAKRTVIDADPVFKGNDARKKKVIKKPKKIKKIDQPKPKKTEKKDEKEPKKKNQDYDDLYQRYMDKADTEEKDGGAK